MNTHIDTVAKEAWAAFLTYRNAEPKLKAALLQSIGSSIDANRKELIAIAQQETHLATDRLDLEVSRTVNQCFLFAELLNECSWVRAIIDTALPERKPIPRPDIRQMQVALGPVAVFGASNFPFAYSVFGGDTVAAIAAGCTVVYKVNPGHPKTSDAVAEIVNTSASQLRLPAGVFQHIHAPDYETGISLVTHPLIRAVGFTGSFRGGRAIYDAACKRKEPIPVYSEMGSTNPVFILPRILEQRYSELATTLWASNTSSAGQFCTNPGIMITAPGDSAAHFNRLFAKQISATEPANMLNNAIAENFQKSAQRASEKSGVNTVTSNKKASVGQGAAYVFETTVSNFLNTDELQEEMFGPASVHVIAEQPGDLLRIAEELPGQLTASVWGTDDDLQEYKDLINYLQLKAGRIIINGVPTGVEVSPAMNHGGPYPATTDSKFTSVGTQSIYRFTRPVCFQNYPQQLLPAELRDENELGIWRMVNGSFTSDV